MAVTYLSGFEGQAVTVEALGAVLTGTAAYSTAQARTGAASIRCNPGSGASGYFQPGNPSGGWVHFGFYIASLPSVTRTMANTAAAGAVALKLTSTGAIECWVDNVNLGTTSALSTATWHWIAFRNNTGTSVEWLQVNGTNAGFTATATISSGLSTLGFSGTEASAIDAYFDDLIIDNAGFLAASKVDFALPISDNTRTAVTAGAGGTTNLWDAVNNTPPAGVASASETDTTNIEYPASLTEDYIANLETYTTLGINTGDTVLAVQAIVRHGEDIATGTKTAQNCGALTNPTVAGANITFGSDGGAHGAEAGLWVTQRGTLTTSPSVTLGTSPTIRTSRVSEARVGCIDFMGMLVAWTPAAAADRIIKLNQYPQLLAQ